MQMYPYDIDDYVLINTISNRIYKAFDLVDIIKGVNLVINCMDEPNMEYTSIILDQICQKMNIPF